MTTNSKFDLLISIKKYRTYILVFLLALGLRLGFFLMVHPFGPGGDEKLLVLDATGYHNIAVSLLETGAYPPNDDYQSMIRTIGYPLFIALIYSVFGIHPWVVVLTQIVLDSLLALILMRFAMLFDLKKVSVWAGVLWAVEPLGLLYANSLLSDSLYIFFMIISFFLLARYLIKNRKTDFVLSSFILALSAHIRPVSLYLFVLLAFVLLYKMIKENAFKRYIIFVAVFILTISPWLIRNKMVHKHFFFSISGDYNSLILYAAPLYVQEKKIDIEKARMALENQILNRFPGLKQKDPFLFYQKYKAKAVNIILTRPLAFLKMSFKNSIKLSLGINREQFFKNLRKTELEVRLIDNMFSGSIIPSIREIFKKLDYSVILFSVFAVILLLFEYTLSIFGFKKLMMQKKDIMNYWIIFFLPIFYFFAIAIPIGFVRFKLPMVPFYILVSIIGLSSLSKMKQRFNIN